MSLVNTTRQTVLATTILRADSPLTRMRGLLGRNAFPKGEALIIIPCQSVHMFFMQFSIDVIFVDQHKCIIGFCKNLRPFMLSPIFWKSSCAIELPTGTIDLTKSQIGDQLAF